MKVEVDDLSFSYEKGETVLNQANLSVETGKSIVVLGASGCGKSTLLKIIAGLLTGTGLSHLNGSASINGLNVLEDPSVFETFRNNGDIGYMFQQPILFDHMTVRENIELPTKIINVKNKPKIDELIEVVGLNGHCKKRPKELSGGMQTRTALARMFSTCPKLLLLDEPFSSLDIARKSVLYEEFHKLNRLFNTTTILVTHDIFEAMVFADELCLMNLNGSTSLYKVEGWKEYESYEKVVEKHRDCFSEISTRMRSHV